MRPFVAIAIPAALAAALAVALSLPSSAAVPVAVRGQLGPLDETELTRMAAVVRSCWNEALEQATRFCINRDETTPQPTLRLDIEGTAPMTKGEARAEIVARRPVAAGLRKKRENSCTLTGSRNTQARLIEDSHYGNGNDLIYLCAQKTTGGVWTWTHSLGVVQMNEDDAVNRAEAGEDITPIVVPTP